MGAPVTTDPTSLTGMKKWLAQYKSKRPGLAALQTAVDDFMVEFDAKEEKAKLEKIASLEEEGWTLVTSNKGRKKTVDAESGVRVGAVSAVSGLVAQEKAKKKAKESLVDFYRFQRRESRRNEVLELQQKFEEDKKKIAKMREARKFRPY